MKTFFNDLWTTQKETSRISKIFYKKHWKGTVVLYIFIVAIEFACIFHEQITNEVIKIKNKIRLNKKEA